MICAHCLLAAILLANPRDILRDGGFTANLQNPSLQLMVPHLVGIVLESSAANTVYKYSNGWQRWKAWAHSKLGVPVLPAVPLQVALYLTELVESAELEGHSASVIESVSYSIRWGHH